MFVQTHNNKQDTDPNPPPKLMKENSNEGCKFQIKTSNVSSRVTQQVLHSTLKPEGDDEVGALKCSGIKVTSVDTAPFFHLQLLFLLLYLDEVVIPRRPSEVCDIEAVIKVNVSTHFNEGYQGKNVSF